MERKAALQNIHLIAVLGILSSCAPALKQSASVRFDIQPSATRTQALTDSTSVQFELSGDYCYAVHVTSPGASFMKVQKTSSSCAHDAPGLGLLKGIYKKGDTAEIEIPVGTKRRFDLLAVKKSLLPGGVCGGTLTGEPKAGSVDHDDVQLFIDGQLLPETTDHSIRLIATGTVDIEPKDTAVELVALAGQDGVEYGCGDNGGSGGSGSPSGPYVSFYAQILVGSNVYIPQVVNSQNATSFHLEGGCSNVGGTVDLAFSYNGTNAQANAIACEVDSWNGSTGRWKIDALNLAGVLSLPDPVSSPLSVVDGVHFSVTQTNAATVTKNLVMPISTYLRLHASAFEVAFASGVYSVSGGQTSYARSGGSAVSVTCPVGWTNCPSPLSASMGYFYFPSGTGSRITAPAGWVPNPNSPPEDMFMVRQTDTNGIDVVLYGWPREF